MGELVVLNSLLKNRAEGTGELGGVDFWGAFFPCRWELVNRGYGGSFIVLPCFFAVWKIVSFVA